MSHTIARSNNSTAAGPSTLTHLNSPIPYLFGGLALMLALIALALIILAWSYRTYEDEENKPAKKVVESVDDDCEPKVVVIMPGNLNPTHLAKPKPVGSLVLGKDDKSGDCVPCGDEQV